MSLQLNSFSRQRGGFTLVELALVMVLIALLIGGVLKGQELLQNARMTATLAQVKAYEAAMITYQDMYKVLPGDTRSSKPQVATAEICANYRPLTDGYCNGTIGLRGWGEFWDWAPQPDVTIIDLNEMWEPAFFWINLSTAGLITGVSDDSWIERGEPPAIGVSNPAARIGGAFVVGQADGVALPGSPVAEGITGVVLAIVQSVITPMGTNPGMQPFSAARAAQMDRRIDDGQPTSGIVQTYGAPSCFGIDSEGGYSEPPTYNQTAGSDDCGLFFQISE